MPAVTISCLARGVLTSSTVAAETFADLSEVIIFEMDALGDIPPGTLITIHALTPYVPAIIGTRQRLSRALKTQTIDQLFEA